MVKSLIPQSFFRSLVNTSLPLYLPVVAGDIRGDCATNLTDLPLETSACCVRRFDIDTNAKQTNESRPVNFLKLNRPIRITPSLILIVWTNDHKSSEL